MPIYEYKCKKCYKVTEKFFKMNKEPDWIICECNYVSNKILSSGIFNIKGYSESNGYSRGNN